MRDPMELADVLEDAPETVEREDILEAAAALRAGATTPDGLRRQLYEKIEACQRAIRTVKSDSSRHAPTVTPQGSIEQITPVLTENHLVLEWDLEDLRENRFELEKADHNGVVYTEVWFRTLVVVRFHLTDATTGFTVTRRSAGGSLNKDGDGVVHAQSQAMKQYLMKTFLVRVGKQEDIDRGAAAAANGAPPPGPPPKPEPSVEERTEYAKAQVRAFLKSKHMKLYHLEAVIQTDKRIRGETVGQLDVQDWETLLDVTRRSPARFDEATRILAEQFPTSAERVKILDSFVKKAKVRGPERMLIEAAKRVGWSDGVEYWITELDLRARGNAPSDA